VIIDFHEHIGLLGRTVEHVLAHQDAHGVGRSVLLPIDGTSYPNERFSSAEALDEASIYPDRFIPFFHIDPRRPGAAERIRRAHRMGARGFGEHKIRLPVDAPESLGVYRLCAELGWPVLLHFQYGVFNYNVGAFEHVLRSNPETVFVGHARSWWANISADVPTDPDAPGYSGYPTGRVVPGGAIDRWLEEFPNCYADLSAHSGLNALSRDPEFTRGFLRRHATKLLWATDCPCRDGAGDCGEEGRHGCWAAGSLPLLRELATPEAFELITSGNARRLLGLPPPEADRTAVA
jgi:predicted TIM-barrel fold metal-dependent hydrolase